MAFIPPPHQYYSHHMFPNNSDELCRLPSTPPAVSGGIAAASGYDTSNGPFNLMPIMDAAMSTISPFPLLHSLQGEDVVSDQPAPAAMLMPSSSPPSPPPRGGYGCQYDYGLLESSFWSSLYPLRPLPSYNTEGIKLEGDGSAKLKEQPAMKIGRYTEEERKDRILRYLRKRNQRNFNKTIKYACRKTLADKRVRVRGRFAKNNGDDDVAVKSKDNDHQRGDLYYQGKQDEEEEWLEEAITSLMYIGGSYDAQFINLSLT